MDESKVKKIRKAVMPESEEPEGKDELGPAAAGDASDEEGEMALAAPPAASVQEVYKYTRKHLMRVYPAGWRVGSG